MTTNAAPPEPTAPTEDAARRAAEIRLFAATWHPLDRIPFPTIPTPLMAEAPQADRTTSRISGYF